MDDDDIRAAMAAHWAASDAQDFEREHEIYAEDAVLEYPQSGERIRSRKNIQTTRTLQPNHKRFSVKRTVGSGRLWVTEFVLSYDDRPYHTVSIMELGDDGKVCRETQYFCEAFPASEWRSQWVERM